MRMWKVSKTAHFFFISVVHPLAHQVFTEHTDHPGTVPGTEDTTVSQNRKSQVEGPVTK